MGKGTKEEKGGKYREVRKRDEKKVGKKWKNGES